MLTKEQKIDFLKCCIAAYDHPKTKKSGFCGYFDRYVHVNKLRVKCFETEFKKFYDFMWKGNDSIIWIAPYTQEGWKYRIAIARQFLKKEYGITVPKKS